MKLVVDANVVIAALITDSKTPALIVALDPDLLTSALIHDAIGRHDELTKWNQCP